MPFVVEAGQAVGGRYVLDRLLGVGGMGQVWAAHHQVTSAPVAVKFLKDDGGPDARRRLLKEARASTAVDHPAVVPVQEVIESDVGEPALVMELLRGETLSARGTPLGLVEATSILLSVAEALQAAHERGIVHRDVKPDNIFLTEEGAVKILDFGIAKRVLVDPETAASAGTQTGAILGTPIFMSPEQAFAEVDVDHRTDIWSLGLVLYECLSGVLPTRADSLGQVLKIILTGGIQSLRSVAPAVPVTLADLVDRMLQRNRDERPQNMSEVVAILRRHARVDSGAPAESIVVLVGSSASADAWAETRAPAQSSSVLSGDSTDSFLQQIAAIPEKAPLAAEPDRTGQRISHYEVKGRLGQGGMGIVYAAEDVRLHRKVALKILPTSVVANEERRLRFLREARSASAVQHANVATVFDVGEADETVYIAMEHVEGKTLRAVLEAEGKLEIPRALDIVLQMAKGLARAHASGIIHRDIKPENVMITSDGNVKLLDFGLAKLLRSSEAPATAADDAAADDLASRAGRILGTPAYMSPEQAAGRLVDARTDVYALGVVLFEMVLGSRPRRGGGVESAMRPRVPPGVTAVLDKCLREDQEDRYADARELGDALGRVTSDKAARTAIRSIAATVVVGLAALLALWWWLGSFGATPATASAPAGVPSMPAVTAAPVPAPIAANATALQPQPVSDTAPEAPVSSAAKFPAGASPGARAARGASTSSSSNGPLAPQTASAKPGWQEAVVTDIPF